MFIYTPDMLKFPACNAKKLQQILSIKGPNQNKHTCYLGRALTLMFICMPGMLKFPAFNAKKLFEKLCNGGPNQKKHLYYTKDPGRVISLNLLESN